MHNNNSDQNNEDNAYEGFQKSGGNSSLYTVPGAIIVAGVLIAGAVVYSNSANAPDVTDSSNETKVVKNNPEIADSKDVDNIRPVSGNDHIRGNPNATLKIVEFSDLECPFCKRFHPTMQQVMREYGDQSKVAWVYRHFPLDKLHSKARKEAEATECANELGGNDKFWAYVDRLFEITPSNDGLELDKLPDIAEDIGLDRDKFKECLSNNKYSQHIEDDYQDAINSGGRGTPYSVVIAPNNDKLVISGAQPFSAVNQVIEAALKIK